MQTQLEPTVIQDHVERLQKALHLHVVRNQSSEELNNGQSAEANSIAAATVGYKKVIEVSLLPKSQQIIARASTPSFGALPFESHGLLGQGVQMVQDTVIELDSTNGRIQKTTAPTFSVTTPIMATYDFKVFLFAEKNIVLQPGIAASTALSTTLSSAEATATLTAVQQDAKKNINNNNKQNEPLLLLKLYSIRLCILQTFSKVIQSFPKNQHRIRQRCWSSVFFLVMQLSTSFF
ncbi:hypothetical protein RFI_29511 [Reticulomyxa filosa]|uniref:Uncharacterized protein n=1 Tax=Reticulomyxa filosa TaxID=46433 RepID=X6M4E5_RETFI|nr:hypothetical protein RFI_29511 [Reticulomyxa filosa]|eukprot:ETO07880.1 hypothetical protein RFI_29511 [Reticulomyxa filosa]